MSREVDTHTDKPIDWQSVSRRPVFHWPQNPIKWKDFFFYFFDEWKIISAKSMWQIHWSENCVNRTNDRKMGQKEVSKLDQIKWTSNRISWIALGYIDTDLSQLSLLNALSPFHNYMWLILWVSAYGLIAISMLKSCNTTSNSLVLMRKWSFQCMKSLCSSCHKKLIWCIISTSVYWCRLQKHTINRRYDDECMNYEMIAIKPNGLNWCSKRIIQQAS